MTLRTVRSDEFPHGLRCITCEFVIPEGACYVAVSSGEDFNVLMCPFCAAKS